MASPHDDAIREQFAVQAPTFTDQGFAVQGLDWIAGLLAPAPGALVLDVAAETERLERLRDPSHGRTLTLAGIQALLAAAGADVTGASRRDNHLDLEDWMRRTRTPPADRATIRDRIEGELAGGDPTGPAPPPRPRRRDHVHPRLGHLHRHPRRLSCGSL